MTLYKFIGEREYSFQNDKGEHVAGKSWWVVFDADGVRGQQAEKISIPSTINTPSVNPGDDVTISFNMKGRVTGVELAKSATTKGFPSK